MDKDKVKGAVDDAAGRVKRQVGEWTDNPNLQAEGAAQQIKGKAEKAWGSVKDAARDANDNVKSDSHNANVNANIAAEDAKNAAHDASVSAKNAARDADLADSKKYPASVGHQSQSHGSQQHRNH